MFRAAWKSVMGRKVRLLLSAFAIVLGIAFVSGSFIFTDMLKNSVDGILKGSLADVQVAATGQFSSATGGLNSVAKPISPALISQIGEVAGVKSVHGVVYSTAAYPLNKNGRVLNATGAPTITGNYFEAPAAGNQPGLVITSGRAPVGDHEIMIDQVALRSAGSQLGDEMTILQSQTNERITATIVGTATWGTGGSAGATYLFFDDAAAQKYFMDGKAEYGSVWITVNQGADPAKVSHSINAMLPAGLEAVDAETAAAFTQGFLDQALSFVNTFLLVFAAIALIVAIFLIVNTFSILVAQRGRELALFRALGASRGQVRTSVLFEALIVGVVGSTVGLGLGWLLAVGFRALFSAFGLDMGKSLPGLSGVAIVAAYAVGILVTMFSAYLPARKASLVPPVAAMTGDVMTGVSGLGRRVVLGVVLIAAGAAALGAGLFLDVPKPLWFVGAGALGLLLGVTATSPLLGRPVTWGLGKLYRRVFGQVGALAELNAARNPRRTAATASALMIGLTLVTTMAILGQTTKASVADLATANVRGNLQVSPILGVQGISSAIGDKVEKLAGVDHVYRSRSLVVGNPADPQDISFIMAMAPGAFDKIMAQTLVSGSFTNQVNTVIVDEGSSKAKDYPNGSQLTLDLGGQSLVLTVTGRFTTPTQGFSGGNITNLATLDALPLPKLDAGLTINTTPGADVGAIKKATEDLLAEDPLVSVSDTADLIAQATAPIDVILNVIYGLLAMAIVIAVLGIVNTLALSVIERTREIGLLRAIGLTRPQLRMMVRLESVVIALLGSALGVGMGLVFGIALFRSLKDQGLNKLDIPVGQLVAFVVVSALVGVLAAVFPARRAAKMDVLQAIATD